ncbi:MAG TPA: protein kinase, partial [Pirellulaceae bacterium]
MDPSFRKLDSIFLEAVELTDDKARAEYLDRACGDETNLRLQVEQLLASDPQLGSFLEAPAYASPTGQPGATVGNRVRSDVDADLTESFIGPNHLCQTLGAGGMGIVYLAEQERPIRRQVAVKTIKPGMDSRQVITRFEAERQALAMMDHPNIARVLDAGDTAPSANGYPARPYFVMELVPGIPITKYCDDKRLSPRERMALFVPVA